MLEKARFWSVWTCGSWSNRASGNDFRSTDKSSWTSIFQWTSDELCQCKRSNGSRVAMITEERKANGLFLKEDLTFNTTIANLNHYKSGIALSEAKIGKGNCR